VTGVYWYTTQSVMNNSTMLKGIFNISFLFYFYCYQSINRCPSLQKHPWSLCFNLWSLYVTEGPYI
jgi:hypothetical protein